MNFYLERFGLFPRLFEEEISKDVFLSVVIPCFNEDDLISCLESLKHCLPTIKSVEVIIIINHSINANADIIQKNEKTFESVCNWLIKNQTEKLKFLPKILALPEKDAGVGLARKAGMDESVRRFEAGGIKDGVIVCLDADCEVSENYLSEIESYFLFNKTCNAASVYFEHRYDLVDGLNRTSIIEYEIFLRYYVNGLRFSGHPFAFHTVGSSMAVRNQVYQKQGGMNKRKAGEDFYFLQKIFLLGNFGELNSCAVYPSCRSSDRVPFGTGRAVGDALNGKNILFYDDQVFVQLKTFFSLIKEYAFDYDFTYFSYKLPTELCEFLNAMGWEEKLIEIKKNVRDKDQFVKRFFSWFDGFMALKAIHFLSENFFPRKIFKDWTPGNILPNQNFSEPEKMLEELRRIDGKCQ
jgi:glycosyltransferase involved in cell wall biosynthesis